MMKFQLHIEADDLQELMDLLRFGAGEDTPHAAAEPVKVEKYIQSMEAASAIVAANPAAVFDVLDGGPKAEKKARKAPEAAAARSELEKTIIEKYTIAPVEEVVIPPKVAAHPPIIIGGPKSGAPADATAPMSDDELKGKLEALMRAAGFPHGVEAAQAGLARYATAGQLPSIPADKREEFLAFVQSEIARLKGAA
jgi:hypothetical protein